MTSPRPCPNSVIRPDTSHSLEWLSSVLYVGNRIHLSARVSRTDRPGEAHQLFGLCAFKDGRALLIPVDSAAAGVGCLRLYRPQKLGARALRTLLILGLRTGLARYILPGAGDLSPGYPLANGARAMFLLDYLREVLGRNDAVFGISFGPPGPVRKPVIAVASRTGQMLGFAKIGWNERTVSLVENERRALEALAGYPFKFGRFPRVTHFGRWNGRCVLMSEPLPIQGRAGGDRKLRPLHIRFLTEVARINQVRRPFAESGFLSRLRGRQQHLRRSPPVVDAAVVEKGLDFLTDSLGSIDIPWVWRLGDFTPWNTRIEKREHRIACIDVEYAEEDGIPGWDLFHFLTQIAGENIHAAGVVLSALRDARPYFEALSIDPRLVPPLYVAYLLDLSTLWAEMWAQHNRPLSAEAGRALARLAGLLEESMHTQAAQQVRTR